MQRAKTARWLGLVTVIAVATGFWAVGAHKETGRALAAARVDAVASLRRVEWANVSEWDPEAYREIQVASRQANEDERAWRAAPWRVGRARAALGAYATLVTRAATAERASASAEREALDASAAMVRTADAAVSATTDVAAAVHLGGPRRAAYQQARLALYEARAYHDQGDYVSAADRARHAIDLARGVRAHAAGLVARFENGALVARWRGWHYDLVEWSRREGKLALLVDKAHHRVHVYDAGREIAVVPADMGFNWVADKQHAGDGATPEGRYRVVARKARGASLYYKALLLDYPNSEDRREFERAKHDGTVPAGAGIGGLIEIHGEGARGKDWTRGCVAVGNDAMDDLFPRTSVGTPVVIVGSLGGAVVATRGPAQRLTASALGGG
jgi:hypothetical protein